MRNSSTGKITALFFAVFWGRSIYAEPGSLENLYDLAEPAPVSWWPLARGWWILLSIMLIALSIYAIYAVKKHRQNAYRRTALAMLKKTNSAHEIAEVLRRTALVIYPRQEIATLHGKQWIEWLEKTGGIPLPPQARESLLNLYTPIPTDKEPLYSFTAEWINCHA